MNPNLKDACYLAYLDKGHPCPRAAATNIQTNICDWNFPLLKLLLEGFQIKKKKPSKISAFLDKTTLSLCTKTRQPLKEKINLSKISFIFVCYK